MNWITLKAGDETAWDKHAPELVSFAKNIVRWRCSGLSPEDVQQAGDQAVILLMNSIADEPEIDSEKGLYTWLQRCAKRRGIDLLRKKGRKKNILGRAESLEVDDEEGESPHTPLEVTDVPDKQVDHIELCSIAADALGSLDAEDAQLFREFYYLRWTQREIAEKHGWETSSVGNRINQALNRARKLLSSDERLKEICSSDL